MNRTAAFTAAHELTRRTLQAGDTYAVTFGQCLKEILAGYVEETPQQAAMRIARMLVANYTDDQFRALKSHPDHYMAAVKRGVSKRTDLGATNATAVCYRIRKIVAASPSMDWQGDYNL